MSALPPAAAPAGTPGTASGGPPPEALRARRASNFGIVQPPAGDLTAGSAARVAAKATEEQYVKHTLEEMTR